MNIKIKKIISLVLIFVIMSISLSTLVSADKVKPERVLPKPRVEKTEPIVIKSPEPEKGSAPMWEYRYVFDRYDANYTATDDFKYYCGEFTVYNYSYTQNATATYQQETTASFSASFTASVSSNASFKAKVVEVGTSVTYSGTLSLTVGSTFSYNAGSTISPRHKATITLYNKGVGIAGKTVYKVYDLSNTFVGYDERIDTSGTNWFPKSNSKTATVSAETAI